MKKEFFFSSEPSRRTRKGLFMFCTWRIYVKGWFRLLETDLNNICVLCCVFVFVCALLIWHFCTNYGTVRLLRGRLKSRYAFALSTPPEQSLLNLTINWRSLIINISKLFTLGKKNWFTPMKLKLAAKKISFGKVYFYFCYQLYVYIEKEVLRSSPDSAMH